MQTKDSTQLQILDSLRAFAALSVVFFHFICTVSGFIQSQFILNVFSLGKYGVHTFFVISGFIIPWSMKKANFKPKHFFNFFFKRLCRLEPPYLFSLLTAIILIYLRYTFYDTSSPFTLSIRQIGLHIGYLIPFFREYQWINVVYWTLAVEFQYYIFIALLYVFFTSNKLYVRIIMYIICVSLSFINNVEFLPNYLPVFLIGILMFMYIDELINKYEFWICILTLIMFSIYKYECGLVLFAVIPVVAILYFKNIKIPILNTIGKFSYSIYLTHTIIGSMIINVLSHHVHGSFQKTCTIIIALVATLVWSRIMYKLVEKPSKKLSSSISYK